MVKTRTQEEVADLVSTAFASFRFPAVQAWAQSLLIPPESHRRHWDYSSSDEMFECWLVAKFSDENWGIAFSDYGHGEPWGLVSLNDPWFGSDANWFELLEDAFIAGGWQGPLPADYEVG